MIEYTDPAVFTSGIAEGWAEAESDPTRINWTFRQAMALLPFQVIAGRPVSPGTPATVQRGRNGLGRWGENSMADALITARTRAGRLYVLLVERGDGHGWAVPGGSIDPGETPIEASRRELGEETGLILPRDLWHAGRARFVPDPRGSDEAWAVTVVAHAHLTPAGRLPAVSGADDARRAVWVPAETYTDVVRVLAREHTGVVFPAHVGLLMDAMGVTA